MKSIMQINTRLMNSIVEESEFSNDISFFFKYINGTNA